MSKYIELYSGNRNRNLYPQPASYQVPFSATQQNITPNKSQDPVANGAIYYTFTLYPQSDDYAIEGKFQDGSTNYNLYLDPTMNNSFGTEPYNFIPNYYKGYIILRISNPVEIRTIRSYDPTSGLITIDAPFSNSATPIIGDGYEIYQTFPESRNYIYIPTVDDNYNIISNYELSYNGYYVVFESINPNYSNSDNSNIFYRKISYYDYNYQIAYFDKPLDFDYDYINDPPQTFTLRKTLPIQRWDLPITTYNNNIQPENPNIGPLIGPVITLPSTASSTDNFYTGKYLYFYNNMPETYKDLYPQPDVSFDPISNLVFYPVYGLYYIKAYNGTTKQLSVCYDSTKSYDVPFPTYGGVAYNVFYFKSNSGTSSLINSYKYYNITFNNTAPYEADLYLDPNYFVVGKTYSFSWNLQDSSSGAISSPLSFVIKDNGNIIYTSPDINISPHTLNFTITPTTTNINFIFKYNPLDLASTYSVRFNSITINGIGYNSSSFNAISGFSSLSQISYNEYKGNFDGVAPYIGNLSIIPDLVPNHKFNMCWCLKSNGNFNTPIYFTVDDGINTLYTSPYISENYKYISFSITPTTNNVTFSFYYDPVDPFENNFIQWQYFFVLDETLQSNSDYNYWYSPTKAIGMNTINITSFTNDNFNPLSYNGSMLSIYQTVCYSISLLSITLPNVPLKTGSRIAFYPYVYVEFANATTPNGASSQIIYSNNPNSNRALFIAPVTQLLQPEANTFITLSGGSMTQTIKFKPNDNLRFSVYLPDGTLFQTLDIDTLPPYSHQPDLQIDAVFSITRMDQSSAQEMP